MAYGELQINLIRSGKTVLYTLFDLIRTNFDDHETRILTLESSIIELPSGIIMPFGSATAPVGYLPCDGSEVSQSTYSDLFAAIGINFNNGSEAPANFRLPDMRGRIPIGTGLGSGLTNRVIGGSIGSEDHSLAIAELPSHTHTTLGDSHTHVWPATAGPDLGVGKRNGVNTLSFSTTTSFTGVSISNTGGGASHSNLHPSSVVGFMIKI